METISNRQLVLIGAAYVMNATLFGAINHVLEAAHIDAWMSVPLAGVAVVFPLWMLAAAARRFPGEDLFEALAWRHPVVGRVLGLMYIAFFFIVLCRDFRALMLFINIVLLEYTPLLVVAMLILVCAVYIARGGLEVASRMMEMWMFLFLLSVLLIPVLLAPDLELHHLFPMLYDGFLPVLHGSWFLIPYFGEIVILPFLTGYPTFNLKNGSLGLALGAAGIFLMIVCTLLVLGANVATRFSFPVHEMVRLIQLTDFLDRLELPLVAIWTPTMITKIAVNMFLAGHGLKQMFPVLSARELMLPFGALATVCSFLFFRDLTELLQFNRLWPFLALLFQFVFPLLFVLFLRSKRRQAKGRA